MKKVAMKMIAAVAAMLCLHQVCMGAVALPQGEEAIVNGCFNAPGDSRLLGWRLRSDVDGSFELTEPQEGSPESVLTITSKATDPKPWMIELHQSVGKAIEKGSTMYVTFEYKMTKGYCFQFYWQEEKAPWPKLLSMRLTSPENAWRRVRVAAPVHETYPAGQTAFSFHLAEAKGILQIREMYAVIVPGDVNVDDLDTNETAILGGDFYDREWRARVTEDMKNARTVPMNIHVYKLRPNAENSKNHPPAQEAVVILKQVSRPFEVGVSAQAPLLYVDLLNRPEFKEFRGRIGGVPSNFNFYRREVIGNPLFRRLFLSDTVSWRSYQDWGAEIVPKMLAECSTAGKSMCLGSLYTPSFSSLPAGMEGMNPVELNQRLMAYIEETVRGHAGAAPREWVVLQDAVSRSEVYNAVGVDSLPQSFQAARRGDGKARLFMGDSHALSDFSESSLQDLVELCVWLRDSGGVSLDGLMLDACMRRTDVAPQSMEKRLKVIAEKLPGVPLHIVNLAVNMSREDFQADMLRDYLLLFYSLPTVQSVSLGELWSPAAPISDLGYLKEDGSPKKSYEMVRKLLTEEWQSNEELKTDNAGNVACTLFGGDYEVVVACGNLTKNFSFTVPEGLLRGAVKDWKVSMDGVDASFDARKKTAVLNIYLK